MTKEEANRQLVADWLWAKHCAVCATTSGKADGILTALQLYVTDDFLTAAENYSIEQLSEEQDEFTFKLAIKNYISSVFGTIK